MDTFQTLISTEAVICPMTAADAADALRQMCAHLRDGGYVDDGYEEDLLRREAKYPTGINTVPFPVAIPHAEDTCVRKPCICIVRLSQPVNFFEMGETGNQVPVRYIFGLVLHKHEEQLKLLQAVMTLFTNERVMEELASAETAAEIVQLLRAHI